MAVDTHPSETLPPPDWDSDALKFYEVVGGEFVENPPMGAMESNLVYASPTRVRVLERGDELDGGALLPGFRVALSTLFEEGTEESGEVAGS